MFPAGVDSGFNAKLYFVIFNHVGLDTNNFDLTETKNILLQVYVLYCYLIYYIFQ